jgi:hypothetical protein
MSAFSSNKSTVGDETKSLLTLYYVLHSLTALGTYSSVPRAVVTSAATVIGSLLL